MAQQKKNSRKKPARNIGGLALMVCAAVGLGVALLLNHAPEKKRDVTIPVQTNAPAPLVIDIGEAKDPDEIAAELVSEGNADIAAGRPEKAIEKFRRAIEILPDDDSAHYNLGIALAALGKVAEAKKSYEKALEIYPEYPDAHNNLGNLLMKEGNFTEAIGHFRQAITNAPDVATGHNNLGTALARQGTIGEAIPYFMEAIRLKPDYLEARLNLANGYMTLGRFDEAGRELKTLLSIDPGFQPAIKAMARLQARTPRDR